MGEIRVCQSCRYYRKKQGLATRKFECDGYCTLEKASNAFRYGYRVDGALYMPVMSNGSCMNYEEASGDC